MKWMARALLLLGLAQLSMQLSSDDQCGPGKQPKATSARCSSGDFQYQDNSGCLDFYRDSMTYAECKTQCGSSAHVATPQTSGERAWIDSFMHNEYCWDGENVYKTCYSDSDCPGSECRQKRIEDNYWSGWKCRQNSDGYNLIPGCSGTWEVLNSGGTTALAEISTQNMIPIFNWDSGESVNLGDGFEHCIEIYEKGSKGSKANDEGCDDDLQCVCQKPIECDLCACGTKKLGNNKASCTSCGEGEAAARGSSSCTDCTLGKYRSSNKCGCDLCGVGKKGKAAKKDSEQEGCEDCPAGQYSNANGAISCVNCNDPQKYTADASGDAKQTGATHCTTCKGTNRVKASGNNKAHRCQCKDGYGGDEVDGDVTTACTECSAGTKMKQTSDVANNHFICDPCKDNEFSLAGSTTCHQCRPNSKRNANHGDQCTCNAGYYATDEESTGHPICAPCEAGKFKNKVGNEACSDCYDATTTPPKKQYQDQAGQTLCDDCGPGFEVKSDGTGCNACATGKFKSSSGSSACQPCAAGKYNDLTGQSHCNTCNPDSGSSFRQSAAGSDGVENCECNTGYTGPHGTSVCEACPPGTYKTTVGSASCTLCGTGKYSTETGKTSLCTVGCPSADSDSKAGSAASTDCLCNKGYSGPDGGSCTQCAAGKYKPVTGSLACIDCVAGKRSESDTGSSVCTQCEVGLYSVAGESTCKNCEDENSQTLDVGQDEAGCKCNKGYTRLTDGESCTACEVGKYKISAGDGECTDCSAGKHNINQGSSDAEACLNCEPGKYSLAGYENCMACEAPSGYNCGEEEPTSDGHECDENTFCLGGTVLPDVCPDGATSYEGQSACTDCVPGKYASGHECVDCTGDKTSHYRQAGSDSCLDAADGNYCPPGFFKASPTSPICKPCSYIGDVDEYYRNWTRAVLYEFDTLPVDETDANNHRDKLKTEASDYPKYRFNGSMHVLHHCSVYTDTVFCPHGMVYHQETVPVCKYYDKPSRPVCAQGEYYRVGDYNCTACPRNLTTLYADSVGLESCAYCREGWYLVETNQSTPRCERCENCSTTVAFGDTSAHRMHACEIPCGPQQMHPDVADRYNCPIFECLTRVRAQDIHPCVFPELGQNMARKHEDELKCHPYFRPVDPSWMKHEDFEAIERSINKKIPLDEGERLYSLPLDSSEHSSNEYLANNTRRIHAIRGLNASRNPYADFYYLFFATNTITDRYPFETSESDKLYAWPQILSEKPIGQETGSLQNSSTKVIDEYLSQEPLLLVKHVDTVEMETSGGLRNGFLNLHTLTEPWKFVDFVRLSFDEYKQDYVQAAVDVCSGLVHLGPNAVYHCHERLFTTTTHIESNWRLFSQQTDTCLEAQFRAKDQCGGTAYNQTEVRGIVLKLAEQHYEDHKHAGIFQLNLTLYKSFQPELVNSDQGQTVSTMCVGDYTEIRNNFFNRTGTNKDHFNCSADDENKWYFNLVCDNRQNLKFFLGFLGRDDDQTDFFLKRESRDLQTVRTLEQIDRDANFEENICNADMPEIDRVRKIRSVEHEDGKLSEYNEVLYNILEGSQEVSWYTCQAKVDSETFPCYVEESSGDGEHAISLPAYALGDSGNGEEVELTICNQENKCIRDKQVKWFGVERQNFQVHNPTSIDFVSKYLAHERFEKTLVSNRLS